MPSILGPANLAEIRDDILTDIVLESDKAGLTEPVGPGSDNYVWATGMAAGLMFAHARIDGDKGACTPVTALGDDLIRWQQTTGVPDAPPSQAAGKITLTINGSATVPDGQAGTLANGQRFTVQGTYSGISDGDEVSVLVDVAGSKGNAAAGSKVTLLNAPVNVTAEAKVSQFEPITGGFDSEDEERLRLRILNHTSTNPGGGNWGQLRQIALNSSPAVQDCFVYPALGGPGTTKVVPVRKFDRERYDFTREYPDASLTLIRDAIHTGISTAFNGSVQAAVDEPTDVAITVTIPDSSLAGGNGLGWSDVTPWPPLTGAETRVTVTAINVAGVVTLDADTVIAPTAGQTRVAWWSPHEMTFIIRTVTTQTGSTGAWVITPDAPWVDATGEKPTIGDFMCPAAENLIDYGASFLTLIEELGAGENTADSVLIANGRALRHPFQANGGARTGLTSYQLNKIQALHPEIDDIAYSYRSVSSPTTPALVATAPNILTPRNLAFYPA